MREAITSSLKRRRPLLESSGNSAPQKRQRSSHIKSPSKKRLETPQYKQIQSSSHFEDSGLSLTSSSSPPVLKSSPSLPSQRLNQYIESWLEETQQMADTDSISSSGSRKRHATEVEIFDNSTPRPKKTFRNQPTLPDTLSASSYSQSVHSQSTKGKRSTSPVKSFVDLSLCVNPIIRQLFDDVDAQIPPSLETVLRDVRRLSRGRGVISVQIQDNINMMHERSFRDIEPDAFGDVNSPSPQDILHIIHHAHTCEKRSHCEASWNCVVHSRLLDLALLHHKNTLGFLNCSTSRIQPSELLPLQQTGDLSAGKMVDFAIYMEETEKLREGLRKVASQHPSITASFNQTFEASLRTTPISVSIETKRTGSDWEEAMLQVGIWVTAQLTRLEQLLRDRGYSIGDARKAMPFLPLLIVQGHEWYFLAASRDIDGKTRIWSKIGIGSTMTPLGAYQIVATISYLANWSEQVYAPWFLRHVLGEMEGENWASRAKVG